MGILRMSDLNDKALEAKRQQAEAKRVYKQKVDQDSSLSRPPLSRATPQKLFDSLPDNSWKGRRAFVVGGGPSLKGFDFDMLEGEKVIACNRSFESCNPDIVIAVDARFWGWVDEGKFGEEARRKYYSLPYRLQVSAAPFPFPPEISTVEEAGIRELVDSYEFGLPFHGGTGLAALLLAYYLGADPIYLLGIDLHKTGTKTLNFHDGYPETGPDDVYSDMAELFGLYAEDIAKKGRTIINLNPSSAVTCFKKQNPNELFTRDWLIEKKEFKKYDEEWRKDYSSRMSLPLASYINDQLEVSDGKDWKCLDIGCGNGQTVEYLRSSGIACYGIDLTLRGVHNSLGSVPSYYEKGSIWRLPFPDNAFDFTFSTDVLEHLPTDMVDRAIKELFRVTRKQTFHNIATFPDSQFLATGGEKILHMTVKPIKWWLSKFSQYRDDSVSVAVSERKLGNGANDFNKYLYQLSGR